MIEWQKQITYLSEIQSVWKSIKPKAYVSAYVSQLFMQVSPTC